MFLLLGYNLLEKQDLIQYTPSPVHLEYTCLIFSVLLSTALRA